MKEEIQHQYHSYNIINLLNNELIKDYINYEMKKKMKDSYIHLNKKKTKINYKLKIELKIK